MPHFGAGEILAAEPGPFELVAQRRAADFYRHAAVGAAVLEGVFRHAVAGVLRFPGACVYGAGVGNGKHAVAAGVGDALCQQERFAVAIFPARLFPVLHQALFPRLPVLGFENLEAFLPRFTTAHAEFGAGHRIARAEVAPVVDDFAIPGGAVHVFLHLHPEAAGARCTLLQFAVGHTVAGIVGAGVLPELAVAHLPAVAVGSIVKADAGLIGLAPARFPRGQRLAGHAVAFADTFPVLGIALEPAGVISALVGRGLALAHVLAGSARGKLLRQAARAIGRAQARPQLGVALFPTGRVAGGSVGRGGLAAIDVVIAEILALGEVGRRPFCTVGLADLLPVADLAGGNALLDRGGTAGQQHGKNQGEYTGSERHGVQI